MPKLGTLPEVTQKLLALGNDPKSAAADFNKIITTDPALSARVLRIVNSSLYGFPGQISSINRAIVMLGITAIRNLALSCSFAKVFQGREIHPGFSPKTLWDHSFQTGIAAQTCAQVLDIGATDEAFLAGLVHDLGHVILAQVEPYAVRDVLTDLPMNPGGYILLEQKFLATDHSLVGAALCRHWHFPVTLVSVAQDHHHPLDTDPSHRRLVCVISLAERLAERANACFSSDLASLDPDPEVLKFLNITPGKLDILRTSVAQRIADTPSWS